VPPAEKLFQCETTYRHGTQPQTSGSRNQMSNRYQIQQKTSEKNPATIHISKSTEKSKVSKNESLRNDKANITRNQWFVQ